MGVINFIRNLPGKLYVNLLLWKLNVYNTLSSKSMLSSDGPTLSMTTYGVRFQTAHLSLEAIARGRVRRRELYSSLMTNHSTITQRKAFSVLSSEVLSCIWLKILGRTPNTTHF